MTLGEHVRRGLPLDGLRAVDVHGHGGPYSLFPIPGNGVGSMLETMDACGIELLLAAPHIGIGPDEEEGNRLSAEMARQSAGRILPYCVVNPNRSTRHVRAQLEEHVASGRAVGVKIHPSLHQASVSAGRYDVAFEYAARARVPVLAHTWEGCAYCSPQALGDAARRRPEVSFVMGHSGGIPAHYGSAVEAVSDAPNVWFDLTGSQSRIGAIERLVALVGAERVLFGSDLPFLDPRPKLGQILFAELTDEAKRAILGANARALFGLSERQGGDLG